jgi:DNA replication and repair protein RecF
MKLNKLKIENWRCYEKFDHSFEDICIIKGPNGSGKTNILEAVFYMATGKSFRISKDEYLLKWDKSFSRLAADMNKEEKNKDLLVVLEKKERIVKTVKIKGQKKPSSHLLGELTCVLFTPEEIDLISTLPEARRRYLNLMLGQLDRSYAHNLIHYKKTLEQRNSLLKRIADGLAKENELEVWDGKLAEYGSEIINKRETFLTEINNILSSKYQLLTGGKEKLEIRYLPSISGEWAGMIIKLTAQRERDIRAGITTLGPHRDDLVFRLNEKDINEFGSRGEFRTAVLALKLAEVDYFEKTTGERPLLLLDDVFSELDEERRDLLSQMLKNQQTIVTTTDLDHVSANILKEAQVVELS